MADSIYWELGRGPQVQFSVRWNFICCNTLISFRSVLVPIPTLNKRSTHIVIFMGHRGASRKSPNNTLWITLNQGSVGWFLQIPDIGQDTCRVPAHPWLYSEHLQVNRIPLTLVRIWKKTLWEEMMHIWIGMLIPKPADLSFAVVFFWLLLIKNHNEVQEM